MSAHSKGKRGKTSREGVGEDSPGAMKPAVGLPADVLFFWWHAGYSYTPGKETAAEGRERGAFALAKAETDARRLGWSFRWLVSELDSSSFRGGEPWRLWDCIAYDGAGAIVGSLCAVDFGRDGTPWGASYRRVVEAELAAGVLL